MAGRTKPAEDLDASGYSFAIVAARFNEHITQRLVDGARTALKDHGGTEDPAELWVPGAFELPLACGWLVGDPTVRTDVGERLFGPRAKETALDAVIALGCVIRGDTPHFDYVAGEAARGLMDVQLASGVPVAFGVLTCDDEDQARARAGGFAGNKGYDAALAAIEMAAIVGELRMVWRR